MPKKSKAQPLATSRFEGFKPSYFRFLKELAVNNDRDWFAENKERYEADVVATTLNFIEAMQAPMRKISPYIQVIAKRMGGSMMRIYRDTRFSKNKDPYKKNIGLHFRHELGGDIHAPGYYLHLEPGSCFVGAGMWMPEAEPLGAIRQLIQDDHRYWKKARDDKKFAAIYKLDGESLKTAPRGIDPSHPYIEDLRRKSFAGLAPLSEKDLAEANCVNTIADAFRDAKPLMKFLCDALNQPF